MLSFIESLVRIFEGLLAPSAAQPKLNEAANDNAELDEVERQWAAYR